MKQEYTKGERCSAEVYARFGFGHFSRCQKKAVIERNGKPYCKIHDPEYIKAKMAEKKAEWDAEWEKKGAYQKLQNTAVRACKEINNTNPLAVAGGIKILHGQLVAGIEALKKALELIDAGQPRAARGYLCGVIAGNDIAVSIAEEEGNEIPSP